LISHRCRTLSHVKLTSLPYNIPQSSVAYLVELAKYNCPCSSSLKTTHSFHIWR